ncbi:MAG TPA: hypothetical protein VGB36_08675 [Gammaproteobacteria bacterium]
MSGQDRWRNDVGFLNRAGNPPSIPGGVRLYNSIGLTIHTSSAGIDTNGAGGLCPVWTGKAVSFHFRGASSLSNSELLYCGKADFGPFVRSFSSNSDGYSPQTSGQNASKPLSLATTA